MINIYAFWFYASKRFFSCLYTEILTCTPLITCDCVMRKLYKKHEHVKFHARDIRGTNHVGKWCIRVRNCIYMICTRKALSIPVPAGRNCHWLSTRTDLKDVRRCVLTINESRIEILRLFSTSIFSCLWNLKDFDTWNDLSLFFVLQMDSTNSFPLTIRHLQLNIYN